MSEAKQIMQGVCLKVFKSNFAPVFLTVQDHHKATPIALGVPQRCALKKGWMKYWFWEKLFPSLARL
jgi:hypothetical protein